MSFCIVARCGRTGDLGVGIASKNLAIGFQSDGAVRPRTGATLTLNAPAPTNNRLAMNLLAQGYAPQHAIAVLRANDPDHTRRLAAIIDREGRAAFYRGVDTHAAAACIVGADCVTMVAGMPGEAAARAMQMRFETSAGLGLDARILAALEAVAAVGTDALRSVALVVYGARDFSDVDLRVDVHEHPIAELRRVYDEYQPFGAYYDERAKNPRAALPQREFADMLERGRGGES